MRVAAASEVILTVAPQGLQIRSANPAVRNSFGVSEERLCQQSLMQILKTQTLPGDGVDALERLLYQASEDGCPYELVGHRRGESPFHWR